MPEFIGERLWEYQRTGVDYAKQKRRTFIADDVGLGKSVQAFATVAELEAWPVVIVCPGYMKPAWKKMVGRWLASMGHHPWQVVMPDHPPSPGTHVVIINYDLLERFASDLEFLRPKAIIFDESQYLKNRRAKRTKTARRLAKNCEVVLCLSATPVESRPEELASQLTVMRRIQEFGGEWWFKQRYAVTHKPWCVSQGVGLCNCGKNVFGYWDFSGSSNLEELSRKLRSTCFIRRTKPEVQQYLPKLRREYVPFEIVNKGEYLRAKKDFIQWVVEHDGPEAAMKAYRAEAITRMNKLKQLAVEGKLEAVEKWIADVAETEPVVVFLWHHKTSSALQNGKLLSQFKPPIIDGDTSISRRAKIVEDFQNGLHRVLLVNIASGGLGIELTRASNCVFVELGWTPAAHDQAEGRLHRHGQEKPVTSWYLMATDTIEETIHGMLGRKQKVVDAILDGKQGTEHVRGTEELVAESLYLSDPNNVEVA